MKKILFITLALISLSASAQQRKNYFDKKRGVYYADTLHVNTQHNTSGAAVFMMKDSATNLSVHRNAASIPLNTWANPTGNVSLNSHKITSLADPSSALDAVNLQFMEQAIDDAINGVSYKDAVQLATEAALPANTYNNGTSGVGATITADANGALTVDGAAATVGDRILVRMESLATPNGIYVVTAVGDGSNPFILTRAADFDQSADINQGDAVFVLGGSTLGATTWYQSTSGTITLGSTSIAFSQIGSSAVADNSISNAKLSQMPTMTIKGNNTGGTSNASDLTTAQVKTMLDLSGSNTGDQDISGLMVKSNNLSDLTNATTARDNLGVEIGADVQAYDADLTTWGTKVVPSGTVVGTSDAQTLTSKRISARTGTVASSGTPTINTDNVDYFSITALAANITSFTTNLTGTPVAGDKLRIVILDNGTPRTLTFGASFEAGTSTPLPTTTVASTRMDLGFIWNEFTNKWRLVAKD
jgi:hypothetical protein